MSYPSPPRPIAPGVYASSQEEFFEAMRARRNVMESLCTALRDYLCYDCDLVLNGPPPEFRDMSRVSPEQFERAQAEVERLESEMERMEESVSKLPDGIGETLMAGMRMMLGSTMQQALDYRDGLQRAMEAQAVSPPPEQNSAARTEAE